MGAGGVSLNDNGIGASASDTGHGAAGSTGGAGGEGPGPVSTDGGGPSSLAFAPLDEPEAEACVALGLGGGAGLSQESFATIPNAVETLRVRDGYAYVAGSDWVIWRYAVDGGDAELVGQSGSRQFEVDDAHVYYLPHNVDDDLIILRRNNAGGGEEFAAGLFGTGVMRAESFLLTEKHVVAFQNNAIVAVPKASLNDGQRLGSETRYPDFAVYDGKNVVWISSLWSNSQVGYEVSALDVRAGNKRTVYTKRAQFLGEYWNLWGADCSHVYFQKCESFGHFCATQRVPTDGGEPETFTALERSENALETVLVTPSGLFYVQDGLVLRVTAPEDEPLTVWQPQTDDLPKALAFDGTTLYVASVSGETTTLWSVPQ